MENIINEIIRTPITLSCDVLVCGGGIAGISAARAGASYVSPFVGRLDDISDNGSELVEQIADIFNMFDIKTEIIAASIRGPQDVTRAALAGADIATIPYKVIIQMIKHPLTDKGIEKFNTDWAGLNNK